MSRTTAIAMLVLVVSSGRVRADGPDEAGTIGHFPLLSAGLVGGLDLTPVSFMDVNNTAKTNTTFNGIAGLEVMSDIDTHAFLVELDGIYSPVGDLRWTTSAHVIFGKRGHSNAVKSIHDSSVDSAGYYTRTTEYYVHKLLPIYYGFTAGVSLWGFDTTTWTSYAIATDQHSRDGSVVPVVDAGFTIRSPQVELTLAPAYDVAGGNMGLRWGFGLALPVGDYPFYCRATGEHLFGDDPSDNSGRRTQFIATFAIGIGSGLGLGL